MVDEPPAFDKESGTPPSPARRGLLWIPWLLGAAGVGAVVVAALHYSEGRELVRVARQAEPWWMILATALQAATYAAQGEVLGCVARTGRFPLRLRTLYQLSVAKLFVDQAMPSAGLSGMFVLASTLERRGMPRAVVAASTVVDIVSCYAAYAVGLGVSLLVTALHGAATVLIIWSSSVFMLFAIAFSVTLLLVSGRPAGELARKLRHVRPLARALHFLQAADLRLVRKPRLLLEASAWQAVILALDSATLWVLIHGLGARASASGVFASFMISTVFRVVGVLPGGLGTFEASSVVTLRLIGVPLPVALAATLLFRGLSFWLPMLPGLWFSRRALKPSRGS